MAVEETADLYRAVSESELTDIMSFAGFRPGMGTMSEVWLSAEEGGRQTPIVSGYRTHFHFDQDAASDHDGVVTLEGPQTVVPGERSVAFVRFLHPEFGDRYLRRGGPLPPERDREPSEGSLSVSSSPARMLSIHVGLKNPRRVAGGPVRSTPQPARPERADSPIGARAQ